MGKRLPAVDLLRIVNRTKKGQSRTEIAEEVGRSQATVYRYQKRLDLI